MTTATCNDLADYRWLTGDEAGAVLNELATDPSPLHTVVARLRRLLPASRTHLVLEQADLRRRAAAKFEHADRMFFTPLGLEQATDQWIAEYKSSRFIAQRAGTSLPPIFADLCCGIGGDLLALAQRAGASPPPTAAIGVDHNPIAAHLAAANARAILNVGIEVRAEDVTNFNLSGVAAWHIDPDRRPTGRRTTSLEGSSPNLATIEQMLAAVPHAAIKLAPAAIVPADWSARCELEWISHNRECRQLVAWHGALAITPGDHRATCLAACGVARTIVGTPNLSSPTTEKIDRYIFDPHPAIRAARLSGTLSAEHSLHALADGPTYLTGPAAINDPALACFEVKDVLPFRQRQLADYLHQRHIGQLEIKTRGIKLNPDQLRRDLKLCGNNSATLLITTIAARPTAILAQRIP